MPDREFDYDVFISHAGEDSAWSERLAERLRHEGLRVWFDKWEIKPGDHLLVRLNLGLENSCQMVTVWSSNYFRDGKTWTLAEIFSQMHGDPLSVNRCLIPLLLDTCKLPPTCLNQVYIDFRRPEDFDAAFKKLIESLPPTTHAMWDDEHGRKCKAVVEQRQVGSARLRLTNHEILIKPSDVLRHFRILRANKTIYSGRSVVQAVIPRESDTLCTVSIDQFLSIPKALIGDCIMPDGTAIQANRVRVSKRRVIVEFPPHVPTLASSQVLRELKLRVGDEVAFLGDAKIKSVIATDTETLCELVLDSVPDTVSVPSPLQAEAEIGNFTQIYGKQTLLDPEFRIAVSDLESLLLDIRSWAELLEFRLADDSTADAADQVVQQSCVSLSNALGEISSRLEEAAASVGTELEMLHRWFAKSRLHPLIMCSPFGFRCYTKALGYAGDYQMVQMMNGNPFEGETCFAKTVNGWLLQQPVFQAYGAARKYLTGTLTQEAARVTSGGQKLSVFSLGCGPAIEIQKFLKGDSDSAGANLTLIDFNNETIQYTQRTLEKVNVESRRNATIHVDRMSVHQLLRRSILKQSTPDKAHYDFVYCDGLFNYLVDVTCGRLLNLLFDWAAPGGLLQVTFMDSSKLRQKSVEYLLDWHLICRTAAEVEKLWPDTLPKRFLSVTTLLPGIHVIEARRPLNS